MENEYMSNNPYFMTEKAKKSKVGKKTNEKKKRRTHKKLGVHPRTGVKRILNSAGQVVSEKRSVRGKQSKSIGTFQAWRQAVEKLCKEGKLNPNPTHIKDLCERMKAISNKPGSTPQQKENYRLVHEEYLRIKAQQSQ